MFISKEKQEATPILNYFSDQQQADLRSTTEKKYQGRVVQSEITNPELASILIPVQ